MTETHLDAWFANQKKRREQITFIEDGLLRNSMSTYLLYRLKYFLLRTLITSLVFGLELRILLSGFEEINFQKSIGLKSLSILLSASWWAGLELMRTEVRTLKRDEKPYLIPRVLLSWQSLSNRIGLGLGAAIVLLALGVSATGSWSPLILYALVAGLRLSVEIPLRCYHSSAYATRRIYRPFIWIVVTELISLSVFFLLRPSIGAWSIGVASLLSLLASSAVSFYFVNRMHRFLGYTRDVAALIKKKKPAYPIPPFRRILTYALPMAFFRLDSLLIVLLALNTTWASLALHPSYLLLIVSAPLLQATQDWGNLFYFDFKRLEMESHGLLKNRLDRSLRFVPVLISVALLIMLPLLVWGPVGLGWRTPSLSFLALFVASSILSIQVIRSFSANHHRILLGWGLSLLACLGALLASSWLGQVETRMWLISLVLLVHAGALAASLRWKPQVSRRTDLSLLEWVRQLRECEEVSGAWVRVHGEETSYLQRLICQELSRRFKREHIRICRLNETQLIFFLKRPLPRLREEIIEGVGGLADGLQVKSEAQTAVNFLNFASHFAPILKCVFTPEQTAENPSLCFRDRDFKKAEYFDLQEEGVRVSERLKPQDYHDILTEALRYLRDMSQPPGRSSHDWDVTAYGSDGQVTRIFAVSRRSAFKTRREWRNWITRKNLSDAWNNA